MCFHDQFEQKFDGSRNEVFSSNLKEKIHAIENKRTI